MYPDQENIVEQLDLPFDLSVKRLERDDDRDHASLTIHLGDANELICEIDDQSVDLIATDPPYGIHFEKNEWDKPNQLNWHDLAKHFKRVLKPSGNLIVFQGWSYVAETKMILDQDFTIKNWIIYDRVKGRGAKTNFVSTREDILWYVMDEKNHVYNKIDSTIKKKTGGMGLKNGTKYRALSNVWSDISPIVPWSKERVKHPTQKPVSLMNRIVEVFSNPNDVVLDPFLGSGTTAVSCQMLGRHCIGFEKNPEYYQIILDRTNNE